MEKKAIDMRRLTLRLKNYNNGYVSGVGTFFSKSFITVFSNSL